MQGDGLRRKFAETQEQCRQLREELGRVQEREKRLQTQRDRLQNREEIMDLQVCLSGISTLSLTRTPLDHNMIQVWLETPNEIFIEVSSFQGAPIRGFYSSPYE